jgi:hypothetical protein
MKKTPAGNTSPALLIILAVILLCAAGFLVYSIIGRPTTGTPSTAVTNPYIIPTSIPTEIPQPTSATPSTGTDSSNASLDSDLQQINTKMNAASAASGQVDTSLQNQSADSVPVQ